MAIHSRRAGQRNWRDSHLANLLLQSAPVIKKFSFYTICQTVNYTVLVVNMRAVARGNVPLSLFTDAIYALIFFTLIRHIAKDESTKAGIAGYLVGSLIGTFFGMHI